MKIATVDDKRRLVLPGAVPGESYAISQGDDGHFHLIKIMLPAKKSKPTARKIDALLKSAALTPQMSAKTLRALTREP